MTSAFDDLYQRLILDHSRAPRNFGTVAGATHRARGENPLCGDLCSLSLRLDADRVADIGFEGAACAISTASASMMTAAVKGNPRAQAEELFQRFDRMIRDPSEDVGDLGDLSALAGVRRFPVRVKCARLPWQTLMAALSGVRDDISTE